MKNVLLTSVGVSGFYSWLGAYSGGDWAYRKRLINTIKSYHAKGNYLPENALLATIFLEYIEAVDGIS